MQQKAKDLFSQENGGQSYDDFRPTYPKEIIQQVADISKGKQNYLDIATGTGQILFELYNHFENLVVGVDISETQLKVAKNKLAKLKASQGESFKPKVELIVGNAYNLVTELEKNQLKCKFDVITIGEALHWFDTEEFINYINNNILETGGRFCVLNYASPKVEYSVGDEEFRKKAQVHFDNYFATIKDSFEYDLNSFFSGYDDIDFQKYYRSVEKFTMSERVKLTIDAFLGYHRTYSGFMTYFKNHENDEGFKDPLEVLRANLEKDLKEFGQQSGEVIPEAKVVMTNEFFYKEMHN